LTFHIDNINKNLNKIRIFENFCRKRLILIEVTLIATIILIYLFSHFIGPS